MMQDSKENPYVGPRTFTEAEANLFFGREREAAELAALVMSERLVLFYAQSGAGKSSLINTRLVPGLRQDGFEVLPIGRVNGELPIGIKALDLDNIFAFNLLLSLDQDQEQAASSLTKTTLADFLGTGETETIPAGYDSVALPHVLIIDQFEEIVTTHLDHWLERKGFFEQLRQALTRHQNLWLVLTMREDYVTALDPYVQILPNPGWARYYMQRMGYESALTAVKKPAELGGRPYAPEVAETLVDNLRQTQVPGSQSTQLGQFVEPVQLQVVCHELWENLREQPAGEITKQNILDAGDVDTALAEFYEHAISAILQKTQVSEIELRRWFDEELITPAQTRGTVYRGTDDTAGLPNSAINLLADRYLLRAEIRSGGTWYELVHDRFVRPIIRANQSWRLRQPLLLAAQAWATSGNGPSGLLEGQQLAEALATNWQGLGPLVGEFLEASQAIQQTKEDALRLEKEAQRQRELANALALAVEQQKRADDQAEAAISLRRRAVLLTGTGVVAVVMALTAAIFAFTSIQYADRARENLFIANQNADTARQNAGIAYSESTRAIDNESTAIAERSTAQAASTLAIENANTAEAARTVAIVERDKAATAEAVAIAQRAIAETASKESLDQLDSAKWARAELEKALEEALTAKLTVPAPTAPPTPLPTDTPGSSSSSGPTPTATVSPTSTPTPTPDRGATATVLALQAQLNEVRVTQTAEKVKEATRTAVAASASQTAEAEAASAAFSGGKLAIPLKFNDRAVVYITDLEGTGLNGPNPVRIIGGIQPMFDQAGQFIIANGMSGGPPGVFTSNDKGQDISLKVRLDSASWPVLSSDGSEVIFSDEARDNELKIRRRDGSIIGLPINNTRVFAENILFSDDQQLVFQGCANWNRRDGECGTWVTDINKVNGMIDINNQNPTRIIIGNNGKPMDAKKGWLTYMSREDGDWDIYLVPLVAGTSDPINLTNNNSEDGLPAISPDGRHVAYLSDESGRWALWIVSINNLQKQHQFDIESRSVKVDTDIWSANRMSWSQ